MLKFEKVKSLSSENIIFLDAYWCYFFSFFNLKIFLLKYKHHKVNKDIWFQKECEVFGITSKFNCIKFSNDDYFDLKMSKSLNEICLFTKLIRDVGFI